MICRWLFRSFFIGLVVTCVSAWVASYWWQVSLSDVARRHQWLLNVNYGEVVIRSELNASSGPPFRVARISPADPEWADDDYDLRVTNLRFLGFAYVPYTGALSGIEVLI